MDPYEKIRKQIEEGAYVPPDALRIEMLVDEATDVLTRLESILRIAEKDGPQALTAEEWQAAVGQAVGGLRIVVLRSESSEKMAERRLNVIRRILESQRPGGSGQGWLRGEAGEE